MATSVARMPPREPVRISATTSTQIDAAAAARAASSRRLPSASAVGTPQTSSAASAFA